MSERMEGAAVAPRLAAAPADEARTGLVFLALAELVLQLATIGRYGWFRDELYYVACGRRLAFGYVDHAPGVALLAWLARVVLGDSLPALRLLPALAGALVVYLTGRLARELGGGRQAQLLAAAAALAAPRLLGTFHIMSMNAFEILLWTLAALVLARLAAGAPPHLWLLFGAIAGGGLETKHSMLFLGLGVAAGLVLTAAGRRALGGPWVYLGGALAALIALPNLIWEGLHGWPTVEFLQNAQATKNLPTSPLGFFVDQVLAMQPFALPVWAAGLGWLLVARRAGRFRLLGWTAATVVVVLLAFRAKGYYLAPLFPLLFAAGAVAIEAAVAARRAARWLHPAYLVVLLAGGALIAPFGLPVLSVPAFLRYQAALGVRPAPIERQELGDLPQSYADMMGWPQMAVQVAAVVRGLPAADQARACIVARNYGEAGALEELGRPLLLPPVISGHNSYYLWGPDGCDGSVLVRLGGAAPALGAECAELRRAGTLHLPHAMPYEDGRPIWICRLRGSLLQSWPHWKSYQ
jgi:hypothetical protein